MVGDVFTGIAAVGAAVSAYFASRALREASATTRALRLANTEAEERFTSESHHRLFQQLQRVSDLLADLAEIISPRSVAGPERANRHTATRMNLIVALDVATKLGGPELLECKRLAQTIGMDDHYEGSLVKAAQEELALALAAQ